MLVHMLRLTQCNCNLHEEIMTAAGMAAHIRCVDVDWVFWFQLGAVVLRGMRVRTLAASYKFGRTTPAALMQPICSCNHPVTMHMSHPTRAPPSTKLHRIPDDKVQTMPCRFQKAAYSRLHSLLHCALAPDQSH